VTVIEAVSGEAVLEHLRAAAQGGPPIDLVLMDLGMPGMGGLAATRALRALDSAIAHVPVIALTGHAQEDMGAQATQAGVSDYLVKPVQPPALLAVLRRHLAAAGAMAWAPVPVTSHVRDPIDGDWVVPAPPRLQPSELLAPDVEQLRQVDMIDALPIYLEQMHRQLLRLRQAQQADDFANAHDALHSLLGASGDSGASALHSAARGHYAAFAAHHWPSEPGWLETLGELARATDAAMRAHYIPRSPPG
ncbi:MAG: response regulator, partial [Lysobacteraceae bacterium]